MGIIDSVTNFVYTRPVSYWTDKKAEDITAKDGAKVLGTAAVVPAVAAGLIVTAPVATAVIAAGGLILAACGDGGEDRAENAKKAANFVNDRGIEFGCDGGAECFVPDGAQENEIPEDNETTKPEDTVDAPEDAINPDQPLFERTIDLYFENRGDIHYISPKNPIEIQIDKKGLADTELYVKFYFENHTIDDCFKEVCIPGFANVTKDPELCKDLKDEGAELPDGMCCNNYTAPPEDPEQYIKAFLDSFSVTDKREDPANYYEEKLAGTKRGDEFYTDGPETGALCKNGEVNGQIPEAVIPQRFNTGDAAYFILDFQAAVDGTNHIRGNKFAGQLKIVVMARKKVE